ncbi:hypothetical protein RvY_00096 [Ramazzottius varieornatus]|uniref:Ubiquitin-like domain-containing protein n=1 Tax=Ramazzottius varieornatus TaxID=947166 RepID=A0A1D1ULJ5_RAMVA|nr:hypothetical protein RvY_00096 [Ramazzottius varieornatus]
MADTTMETPDMESIPLSLDTESMEKETAVGPKTPEPPTETESQPECRTPKKETEETRAVRKADVTASMDVEEQEDIKPDIENIKQEEPMDEEEMEEEAKPVRKEKKPKKVIISVKVNSQENQQFIFKVTPQTPLEKIMDSYAQRTERPLKNLRFFYDGKRLRTIDTPEMLEMEDNDSIDVTEEVLGGAGSF